MVDRVAKYEAWAKEIKGQLAAYRKLRRQVRFFPLFAVATAPLGLVVGLWAAVTIAFAWLGLWSTTLYITYMRSWQYRNELAVTYAEVERLRAGERDRSGEATGPTAAA